MPDETGTETAVEEPTEAVTPEPEVHAPDGPSPEEIARQERDARIRAEGEAAAYREAARRQPPPERRPAEQPTPVYSPQQIEAARAAGQIDAARAGLEYERYIQASQQAAVTRARDEEREAARQDVITEQMTSIIAARPHLKDDINHPETQAALRWIHQHGGNPADRAQQLMAMKALGYGNGGTVTSGNEARRSKVLGGGGGPSAGGGGGGTVNPLRGIPADYVAAWQRTGADLTDPKVAQRHADRYWASRHRAGQVRPA